MSAPNHHYETTSAPYLPAAVRAIEAIRRAQASWTGLDWETSELTALCAAERAVARAESALEDAQEADAEFAARKYDADADDMDDWWTQALERAEAELAAADERLANAQEIYDRHEAAVQADAARAHSEGDAAIAALRHGDVDGALQRLRVATRIEEDWSDMGHYRGALHTVCHMHGHDPDVWR